MRPVSKIIAAALVGAAAIAAPSAASAQLFYQKPDFRRGAIEAEDPLVGLALPGATPAEYRAHLMWNLRSGLNVAALQCQFSPYLRAVDNYNDFLAHHSGELATAYTALEGYFRRVHGTRDGPRKFDDYSTTTYNNFSTLEAQRGFCQAAADIAKEALTLRHGELHQFAAGRMRELRNSLTPVYDYIQAYNPYAIRLAPLDFLQGPAVRDCSTLSRRERRRCEREQAAAR